MKPRSRALSLASQHCGPALGRVVDVAKIGMGSKGGPRPTDCPGIRHGLRHRKLPGSDPGRTVGLARHDALDRERRKLGHDEEKSQRHQRKDEALLPAARTR